MNREALKALMEAGGAKAAEKLADATGEKWRVESVAVSIEDAGPFDALMNSAAKDHYGSHFSIPGASFVVMFPGKSGYLVSTAFTRAAVAVYVLQAIVTGKLEAAWISVAAFDGACVLVQAIGLRRKWLKDAK